MVSANLLGANLKGAFLVDADLSYANLFSANLQNAFLDEARLENANLNDANLKGATLEDAKLEGASLQRTSLEGANLMGASITRDQVVAALTDADTAFPWSTASSDTRDAPGPFIVSASFPPRRRAEADVKETAEASSEVPGESRHKPKS